VVFHGTFVPLQGVATIAEAADHLRDDGIRIRIIGDGQDGDVLRERMRELDTTNVDWVGLLPLPEIPGEIARAAVCLGVFGTSDKAGRVVPNKVYECLAVGRPVITREGPAMSDMFAPGELVTVPAGDPGALAAEIRRLVAQTDERERIAAAGRRAYADRFHERTLVALLGQHLDELV
jgi:glycosyltransferase involved in cell wall biosynthesis